MKIELWGTYPPPIGGVSIHVYRLIHNLHKLDSEIVLKDFGSGNSGFSYVKSVKSKWWEFLRLFFFEVIECLLLCIKDIYCR